jgi:hypothetical protein
MLSVGRIPAPFAPSSAMGVAPGCAATTYRSSDPCWFVPYFARL